MNNSQTRFIIAALTILATPAAFAQGPASGVNVNVINQTPIPVSGTVTGTVTGTVSLAPGTSVGLASGTAVGLSSGTAVKVNNAADSPVPVRTSAPTAFQITAACSVFGTGTIGQTCDLDQTATVPAGKRLVIEWAGFSGCLPAGQAIYFTVHTTAGGKSVVHDIGMTPAAATPTATSYCFSPGMNRTSDGKTVHFYADAGTIVSMTARRTLDGGVASFEGQLAGHYEDVQ